MSRRGARCSSAARQAGYTLIEMLVVLALLATLLGGVSGMLWSTNHAQRDSRDLAATDRVAARVLRALVRDLDGAILGEGPYHEAGFVGADVDDDGEATDTLRFVTLAGRISMRLDWEAGLLEVTKPVRRRCDLVEVEYHLELDPDSGQLGLYRKERALITSVETDEDRQWSDRLLAKEVSWFDLKFGDGEGNSEDSWSSSEKEDALPKTVELVLEIDLDTERSFGARAELREQELEGAKTPGRRRVFRLFRLPIEALPDLSEAALSGQPPEQGGGSGSTGGGGGR